MWTCNGHNPSSRLAKLERPHTSSAFRADDRAHPRCLKQVPKRLWHHLGEQLGIELPDLGTLRTLYDDRTDTLADHQKLAYEALGFRPRPSISDAMWCAGSRSGCPAGRIAARRCTTSSSVFTSTES